MTRRLNAAVLSKPPYIQRIRGLAPLAFWPLNEASGSVAYDFSGNAYNGAYTGVDLGQPGQAGQTCPYFDGTNDFVNVYSAGFAAAFPGQSGSIALWCKIYDAATWSDGSNDYQIGFTVDGSNAVLMRKSSTANRLIYIYQAGGTTKQVNRDSSNSTDWMHLAFTWSLSNNQMIAYYNGVQTGSTQTGLGTWAGAISSIQSLIGAYITTPLNTWKGWLQYVAIWNRPITPLEVAKLHSFFG